MTLQILELEGAWEEILTHASELAGHTVRVTVISDSEPLKSAEECFRQGWHEAMTGETVPLSEPWEGIDAGIVEMMESLPETLQQQVVEYLKEYIADLKDELQWDESFKKTQPQLVAAAQRAKKEIAEGKAREMKLNEL